MLTFHSYCGEKYVCTQPDNFVQHPHKTSRNKILSRVLHDVTSTACKIALHPAASVM